MPFTQVTRRTTTPLRGVVALAALAFMAAACSDSSVAPTRARSASEQPLLSKNDGQGSFTYDPSVDATFRLGDNDHKIIIPAGAVCMIGKTKYGPGTWDLPCRAEDKK